MSGHYSFPFWDKDDALSFHSWTHHGSKVISKGWHNRWSVWIKLSFTFRNVCIERKCKSIRFSSIFDPGLTFFSFFFLSMSFLWILWICCRSLPSPPRYLFGIFVHLDIILRSRAIESPTCPFSRGFLLLFCCLQIIFLTQ